MNTYVDKIFKYIGKRFNNLSQFLFDETINSKLKIERRWFKANKKQLKSMYPYKRADAIRRNIQMMC